jgi:DNA-binding NtrC family response regulator
MSGLEAIVGDSLPMRRLKDLIRRVGPTNLPVLVSGPTGAGKELVAQAIHDASGRRGRFVSFNVCAIADTMFEDALFGHRRGAFTGAFADSPGYLLEADRGTVFFDEISGLALLQQAKLLRAIETRQFRPVGGRQDKDSDFRVVAATNEDLGSLVRNGRFRPDLLHRLGGITIEVPALRARPEDIPLLIQHFLGDEQAGLTGDAVRALREHDWPGNVRELRHTLERARVLASGRIGAGDIRAALQGMMRTDWSPPACSKDRQQLIEALEECDWNPSRTAVVLGVHWTTIYRRMKRLGIPPGEHARQREAQIAKGQVTAERRLALD